MRKRLRDAQELRRPPRMDVLCDRFRAPVLTGHEGPSGATAKGSCYDKDWESRTLAPNTTSTLPVYMSDICKSPRLRRCLTSKLAIPWPGMALSTAEGPKSVETLSRLHPSEITVKSHVLFTHDHDCFMHESSHEFRSREIGVSCLKKSLGRELRAMLWQAMGYVGSRCYAYPG